MHPAIPSAPPPPPHSRLLPPLYPCRILCETLYSDETAARHYAARFASAKYNPIYELSLAANPPKRDRKKTTERHRGTLIRMKFVIIEILKESSHLMSSLSSARDSIYPWAFGLSWDHLLLRGNWGLRSETGIEDKTETCASDKMIMISGVAEVITTS